MFCLQFDFEILIEKLVKFGKINDQKIIIIWADLTIDNLLKMDQGKFNDLSMEKCKS